MSERSKARFRARLTELGYRHYWEYLTSEHWLDVRNRYFHSKLFKGKCAGCGRVPRNYELHHRTYKRLGNEWLMDLVALCGPCHSRVHRTQGRADLWKATRKITHAGGRKASGAHAPLQGGKA